ncbi:hypothetical protein EV200_105341 [Pedobacter psychrotolerans]|uniref:Uncharacterized protein n=1 Tax=Pedobacter psychrotolerans TaxID=1843235 RepID=A0A4R2H9T5_9SPHI|nr:hypothetical protein [Pedobacter psychrotolerans]TCO23867.1 hypothetical protein EV200_105341 [Pedobacter psychrotolerans]GGE63205.1 hypothetical protein GCM10011413_31990 [Pedobacter psychrotolerans]
MNFFNPIIIAEIICLIVALFLLLKDKISFWKVNIAYLVIALSTEARGAYLAILRHHNLGLYNTFLLFEIAFISYGMYYCLKKYIDPRPIVFTGLGICYLIFTIFTFKNGIHAYNDIFNDNTVNVMSVIFVLYCLYYYYKLLNDEETLELKHHPEFWWVNGVLFYYFGSTATNLTYDLFKIKLFEHIPLRLFIYYITNTILYSNWIYSYICRAKQRKLQH